MKVSRDRSTWVPLGAWYKDATRSIFAMNSNVIKLSDTNIHVGGSGYKKSFQKQVPESRVLNVSGLILADNVETVRQRELQINSMIVGDDVYFLDEHYNMVIRGSVPNINITPDRGKLDGRSSLLNFNVTANDPYWTSLSRYVHDYSSMAVIEVDYDMLYAVDTDFTIEFTSKTSMFSVGELISGLITLAPSVSLDYGDKLTFSTENNEFRAFKTHGSTITSVLGNISDSFFVNRLVLTPGSNSFTINSSIENYFDVEVSYYGRSL